MAILHTEADDRYDVHPPGTWQNDVGPKDWYALSDETGIICYAATEKLACDIQMMLRAKAGVV